MRRRMAALPALCLTGTLVLSGGWSQTAMASAVSEDAADTASETAAEAQTPDQPDSADHTDHSDAAGAPEEQLAGTDHGDASQNADRQADHRQQMEQMVQAGQTSRRMHRPRRLMNHRTRRPRKRMNYRTRRRTRQRMVRKR